MKNLISQDHKAPLLLCRTFQPRQHQQLLFWGTGTFVVGVILTAESCDILHVENGFTLHPPGCWTNLKMPTWQFFYCGFSCSLGKLSVCQWPPFWQEAHRWWLHQGHHPCQVLSLRQTSTEVSAVWLLPWRTHSLFQDHQLQHCNTTISSYQLCQELLQPSRPTNDSPPPIHFFQITPVLNNTIIYVGVLSHSSTSILEFPAKQLCLTDIAQTPPRPTLTNPKTTLKQLQDSFMAFLWQPCDNFWTKLRQSSNFF